MPEENEQQNEGLYERYIGYEKEQLGEYNENHNFVFYSEEKQQEIKDNLERHLKQMIASWERNGFASCFKEKHVIRNKIDNLMMKKYHEAMKNYSQDRNMTNNERLVGLESFAAYGAFAKIEKDNELELMYKYYASINEYKYPDNKLRNKSKEYIKGKIYANIKSADAIDLATLRFDESETLLDHAATIKELKDYHNSHGSFYWLFHPINCFKENRMIKSLKLRTIEKLYCSMEELNEEIDNDIQLTELSNSNSFKIEAYADKYCNGIKFSSNFIKEDSRTIEVRADDDYTKLRDEFERLENGEDLQNDSRQNINVDDLNDNNQIEQQPPFAEDKNKRNEREL